MTKEEYVQISKWRNDYLLEGQVFSNFLGQNISLQVGFSQFDNDRTLADFTINSINDFLNLDTSNLEWIKHELWKVCIGTFENASYGNREHVKDGQSELDANKELFGIYTIEDSFQQSKPVCVFIDNNNGGQNRSLFWLEYSSTWDIEHNTIFIFKNGEKYAVE